MFPLQLPHTLFLFCIILLPALSNAYSWQLHTAPRQCSNVSISIIGSDGHPPYRVLVIPFGPSPLPGSIEVRDFVDLSFNGNSTSIDFPLNYPARSQLVAVVSDATGFATGGTSMVMTVADSNEASCFNASKATSSPFQFSLSPGFFSQCLPNLIWWNGKDAQQRTPTFHAIVPGGQSFTVPTTNVGNVNVTGVQSFTIPTTNATNGAKGFSWTPSLPVGTTFALIGNSSDGIGSGMTIVYSVAYSDDRSCLNSTNPSLTSENPAGSIADTDGNLNRVNCKSKRMNDAAIVGGILGGVITALLFTLLRMRCRWRNNKPRMLEIDLSDLDEPCYQVTLHSRQSSRDLEPNRPPFDSFSGPRWPRGRDKEGPLSHSRKANQINEGTSDGASLNVPRSSHRRGTSSRTRLVIQHGDAGPSTSPSPSTLSHGERDVVELPPAYTNIRRSIQHLNRFKFCPSQSK